MTKSLFLIWVKNALASQIASIQNMGKEFLRVRKVVFLTMNYFLYDKWNFFTQAQQKISYETYLTLEYRGHNFIKRLDNDKLRLSGLHWDHLSALAIS